MSDDLVKRLRGWPDPARPGVPLNPDRNGIHKIGKYFLIWRAETQDYVNHNGNVLPPEVAYVLPYHGPCLTPEEIAAKNARIEELEAALREIEYLDRPQVRGMPRRRTIQEIALAALAGGKDE